MQYNKFSVGDYTIPVLMNHVELAPHSQLFVFVNSKAKAMPLSNAVQDNDPDDEGGDDDHDDEVGDGGQPEAKAGPKGKAKAQAKPKGNAKAKVKGVPEHPMKKART